MKTFRFGQSGLEIPHAAKLMWDAKRILPHVPATNQRWL